MPNEIKITVTSKDSSNLDAAGRKAGKDLADGVRKGAAEAAKSVDSATKQIKSDVDKAGSSAKSAGREIATGIDSGADKAARSVDSAGKSIKKDLASAGDAGKEAGSKLGEGLSQGLSQIASSGGGAGGSLLGGLTDSLASGKAGILGAGLALGGALLDGFQTAAEQRSVGAMIAQQTGAASSEAGHLGTIAGNIFRDNFGESIEEVGQSMSAVFQNHLIDTSAPEDAITRVTEKVMTVADTVGEGTDRVARSARTMVVNGVAKNVSEALDIIQRATEKGLNTAGDLLDTIDEYSVQFSKVGLSGQEAMGLISQALKGGARDADVAADAIKEFAIRAVDGSALTKRGFEAIGLSSAEMSAKMASGGKNAHEALRMTLNALQAMPPGIERSTAAVDLFGTKAEDMGDALFDMDLDTVAKEFDNVAGSLDKAMQKASEGQTGWDRMGKNISGATTALGDWLAGLGDFDPDSKIGVATQKSKEFATAIGQFKDTGSTQFLDELKGKYPELSGAIDEYISKNADEAGATERTTGQIKTQIETLDEWIAKKQEAAGVVLSARDTERAYQEAIDDTTKAVKDNGKTHDDNTEKGRANNEMLDKLAKTALDHAASMEKDSASVQDVNKHMNDSRNRFIAAAQAMGYSKAEAVALANKLKLLPRQVSIAVLMRDAAARANLASLKRAIDNIPRTITVSTYVRGANIVPGGGSGHQFLSQASGGITPHAQEGGARTGSTLINEAGPELVQLPSGTRVFTAGATRAMAERGLLGDVGTFDTAATGGVRGRAMPAYQRTGIADIRAGQHSERFINNLLHQGWRAMDGDYTKLYSPALQRRAGAGRRFTSGDVASTGHGGILDSMARAQALTGPANVAMVVAGDADSAVGAMINRLVNDRVIRFEVRS